MNKEVIKAMNKKPTMWDAICEWWSNNGYKVMRILLFPVWAIVWSYEKINKRMNDRAVWSEERAAEILSYYIPRRAEWNAEKKRFYFYDNGMGWNISRKHMRKYIKLRDRRFWKCWVGFWGGRIRSYLMDSFELEGFTKEVIETYDSEATEIVFTLRED